MNRRKQIKAALDFLKTTTKEETTMSMETALYQAAGADVARLSEYRARSVQDFTKPGRDNWTHEVVYEFRDGERVTLERSGVDSMAFPASPGYERLVPHLVDTADLETLTVKRLPVIGWLIRYNDSIYPITLDYEEYMHGIEAVALPDGRVTANHPLSNTYQSESEWMAAIRDYQKAAAQKQAEAEKPCPTCGKAKGCDVDEDIPF